MNVFLTFLVVVMMAPIFLTLFFIFLAVGIALTVLAACRELYQFFR